MNKSHPVGAAPARYTRIVTLLLDGWSSRSSKRARTAFSFALIAAASALEIACGKDADAGSATPEPAALSVRATGSSPVGPVADSDPASYSGTDSRGIPHYVNRTFTSDERAILRQAFGVVSPSHLYLSDSTEDGLLKYDPDVKRCAWCYVNSFRLGFVSIRNRGESWDELERRVRAMRRSSFAPSSLVTSSSLSALDPDIQPEVKEMLDAARRAGFELRVGTTYRSPQQETLLMAEGSGRTHTLTSLHSYGRAIDISVGDGNPSHPATRTEWIAFRRWVTHYRGSDFRVLGTPDRTWDWPHVELPSNRIGFRNLDQAIAAGRVCLSKGMTGSCEFEPHLR